MFLLRGLTELLFPPRCLLCRASREFPLCRTCFEGFPRVPLPLCRLCGCPLQSSSPDLCAGCAAHRPPFRLARAATLYAGEARDAIHALKFHGRRRLADPLGRVMAAVAQRDAAFDGLDVVVPVPLHPHRARTRGFNQAELLARPVAEALALPLRRDLLTRVQDSPPQHRLHMQERRLNVGGGFAARELHHHPSVLLVDDVMTTGSTVSACAQALRQAGAVEVSVLVFALTLRE